MRDETVPRTSSPLNSVKPTPFYSKEVIDRCVEVAKDVLLGGSCAYSREYEMGVKDTLRLLQTALAISAA